MTPLPELPVNLRTGFSAPRLPSFPNLPNIDEKVDAAKSLVESATNIPIPSIDTDALANLIPEGLVDQLMAQYKLPDGSVDFGKVNELLNEKIEQIQRATTVPEIPDISVSGLLAKLIPTIPVIRIPTPAQLQNRINQLIEKKKVAQQKLLIQAQLEKANLEKTPFTARRRQVNDIARLINSNSVITRTNL